MEVSTMSNIPFTAEALVSQWEDARAIENLMGRRSFQGMLQGDDFVWEHFWCKNASEPCLGFNNGYYKGYQAISGYFSALRQLNTLKASLIAKAFPEKLGAKAPDEIYGAGSLSVDSLSTPVIELAADGQTAKGLWYQGGGGFELTVRGPKAYWNWGRIAVDFIKEDGEWKIWHLLIVTDIKCETGSSWVNGNPAPMGEALLEYKVLANFIMPEPNVPMTVYENWHKKRPLKPFPPVPSRYEKFADTFSYGI